MTEMTLCLDMKFSDSALGLGKVQFIPGISPQHVFTSRSLQFVSLATSEVKIKQRTTATLNGTNTCNSCNDEKQTAYYKITNNKVKSI